MVTRCFLWTRGRLSGRSMTPIVPVTGASTWNEWPNNWQRYVRHLASTLPSDTERKSTKLSANSLISQFNTALEGRISVVRIWKEYFVISSILFPFGSLYFTSWFECAWIFVEPSSSLNGFAPSQYILKLLCKLLGSLWSHTGTWNINLKLETTCNVRYLKLILKNPNNFGFKSVFTQMRRLLWVPILVLYL